MNIAPLLGFGALLAASTALLHCGGDSSGGFADGGICPASTMDGEDCVSVGAVCADNVQSCRCTMGRRDAGSSWNCDPVGGDDGGFGGRGGTGRDGGGFGGFGGFGRDGGGFGGAGGGRRGDGG